MARYLALIGDIRRSRQVEDRQAIQSRFRATVEALSTVHEAGALASPPTVTTGDEFQALYREDAGAVVEAIAEVADRMAPTRLRFGVGFGPLETQLNEDAAIGMDGPCFHRAREAIDDAKDRNGWVRVRGFGGPFDRNLGALFDTVGAIREGWTDRQVEFARAFRAAAVQKDVAARFDVSPSVVSESLHRAHVHEVFAAEASLARLLQHAIDQVEPGGQEP